MTPNSSRALLRLGSGWRSSMSTGFGASSTRNWDAARGVCVTNAARSHEGGASLGRLGRKCRLSVLVERVVLEGGLPKRGRDVERPGLTRAAESATPLKKGSSGGTRPLSGNWSGKSTGLPT
eukprot:1063303-Rhodomonas_salina.3